MSNRKRLTADDWDNVRNVWEADDRDGYAWIVRELDLPVSRVAVSKRANKEGWAKGGVTTLEKPKARKKVTQAKKVAKKAVKKAVKKVTQAAKPVTSVTTVTDTTVTATDVEPIQDKAPVGRPTDYRDKFVKQAYKLCLLGATDKQLADFFEIHESTLNEWKIRHPEFGESIREAKFVADGEVAKALYNRAIGYDHEAIHFATINGEVVQTPYIKHHAPDPWAASWWLKNRQPTLWKDKVEIKEEVDVTVFPSRETLDAIYNKALAEAEVIEMEIVNGRAERLGISLDSIGSGDSE